MTEKPFRYTQNAEKVIRDNAEKGTAQYLDQVHFDSLVQHIIAAQEEAIKRQVEADTIVIKPGIAISNGIRSSIDPTAHPILLGMKVIYDNSSAPFLSDNVTFALMQTKEKEDRKDNIIRIVKQTIAAHAGIDDEHGIVILDCNDVDHIAEEIAENIAQG